MITHDDATKGGAVAVVYRAVWTQQGAPDPAQVHHVADAWLRRTRGLSAPTLPTRPGTAETAAGDTTITCRLPASSDGPSYLLTVTVALGDETRTTSLQIGPHGREQTWVWAEVSIESETAEMRAVSAPGLVVALLDGADQPSIHAQPISTTFIEATGAAAGSHLAETILDPSRTVPVVVFNDNARILDLSGGPASAIAAATAQAAAGIAVVYLADDTAATAATAILGSEHGFWSGVMRIFLPTVIVGDAASARRHRYYLPDPYLTSSGSALRAVLSRLGLRSTLRPAPAAARNAPITTAECDCTPTQSVPTPERTPEPVPVAPVASTAAIANSAPDWQLLEEVSLDLAVAVEQNARLSQQVHDLTRHVQSLQQAATVPDTYAPRPAAAIPDGCGSPSEAYALARRHLGDLLVLPETAAVDLETLDATVTATAWGQTSWLGLRALHAFAQARRDGWSGGGFWEWCRTSGDPLAWPATPKKLAMRESATVGASRKLMAARTFAVPTEYAADGKLQMEAHLKISEGGGNLAPRLYFEPDPRSGGKPVNKVIVGYFGPHKHLPNTRS